MGAVLLQGLLTGWAIAVPVGAVGALLVAVTARTSWRVGAAGALGVASVDGAYAAVAALGGAAVAGLLAPVSDALRVVAAVVLLVVAALLLRTAWRVGREDEPSGGAGAGRDLTRLRPVAAYWLFVGLTAVNPTTVVYFVAVVLGNDELVAGAAEATVFVVAAFVASASWQLLLAGAGAVLGTAAGGPRGRRVTGVVASAVVAGLAVATLVG